MCQVALLWKGIDQEDTEYVGREAGGFTVL